MGRDENQLDDFFGLKQENNNGKKGPLFSAPTLNKKLLAVAGLLSKKERFIMLVLLVIAVGTLAAIPITSYYNFTKPAPGYGGSFSEGIVGEPRYVNPLLLQDNDADRDLASLIYSGLMKYNEEGKLVPDLVKSYEVSDDGLNYTIYLKETAEWHDGEPVTADDVIFTIQTAQNSDYGSSQKINWQGVNIEEIDSHALIFRLKNRYAQFLNNFTIGILPQHIWRDIKPINFAMSEYNLKPVGSGPYKFKRFTKDSTGKILSYLLEADRNYYGGRPYIKNIELKFYDSEDQMIDAYNRNAVENLSSISSKNIEKIKFKQRLAVEQLTIPRYFAVFLNQNQSKILSDKKVRLALNYGTDKIKLINDILGNNAKPVDSPLAELPGNDRSLAYGYDQTKAKDLLASAGWINPDESGILHNKDPKSTDKKLELKLTVLNNWPELVETANALKEQWKNIGVSVNISAMSWLELQQTIKDRDYQMLLFGEILPPDPDPIIFWHSTQKRDPGKNLALYDNKAADTLLDDARSTLNPVERAKKYSDFQKLLSDDAPVVFLYNPFYVYGRSKTIKGFDNRLISMPSDRFSQIEKWYINTNRIWN